MPLEFSEIKGNIVCVTASGKLTDDDYDRFVPQMEDLIKQWGRLRMLFEMKDFHGWELGAVWEDLKFDFKHFGHIKRLAMVGDKKWEEYLATFCGPFTAAEVEYFDRSEMEEAQDWLHSDD